MKKEEKIKKRKRKRKEKRTGKEHTHTHTRHSPTRVPIVLWCDAHLGNHNAPQSIGDGRVHTHEIKFHVHALIANNVNVEALRRKRGEKNKERKSEKKGEFQHTCREKKKTGQIFPFSFLPLRLLPPQNFFSYTLARIPHAYLLELFKVPRVIDTGICAGIGRGGGLEKQREEWLSLVLFFFIFIIKRGKKGKKEKKNKPASPAYDAHLCHNHTHHPLFPPSPLPRAHFPRGLDGAPRACGSSPRCSLPCSTSKPTPSLVSRKKFFLLSVSFSPSPPSTSLFKFMIPPSPSPLLHCT